MAALNNSDRAARARMEQAESASRRQREAAETAASGRPRRYKLYDRIRDKVSLTAINIVITVTAVALVALLVYGIATGNPQ